MRLLRKIQYNSPVVLTFALLSAAVLLLNMATRGRSNYLAFCVYRSSPWNPLFYVRLFGHVLGHASWQHLAGNMTFILLLGPMLEEKYTSKGLLEMMLVVALITGLINVAFFQTALLGASGIVFMMIILSSVTGGEEGRIPLTLLVVGALFIGEEILGGLTLKDNISHLTHIIGGMCGGGFGLVLKRNSGK